MLFRTARQSPVSLICSITVFFVLLCLQMSISQALMPPATAYAAVHVYPPASLSDPKELETFLDRVLTQQLTDQHIPGAAVSVVKGGHILLSKGNHCGETSRYISKGSECEPFLCGDRRARYWQGSGRAPPRRGEQRSCDRTRPGCTELDA